MTSVLRELVWLQIQKNPGCTTGQIEIGLGKQKNSGAVSAYIRELYRARKIDRKESYIPTANISGKTRCYLYTAVGEKYSWMTPGATKKAKAAVKAAKAAIANSAKKAPTHVPELWKILKPSPPSVSPVEPWIAMLPSLPVKDVLKLRKAIDEALSV